MLRIFASTAICQYNWGILPRHDGEESIMQSAKEREPVVLAVFHKLGGRSALGRDIASTADLARMVFLRIPLKSLEHLTRSGSFSDQEISDMVIPARTHRHRKQKHERLSVE